ncbi:MAG TPA: hypothetical protein VLJ38_10980, partial [Polyangiaceae bacterium]|nr:hypothetical protein [Polyangiaceae bacterium]
MELALIFLLELGGLALGSALARAAFSAPSTPQVGRVVAALERAARAFLLRALTRFGAFFGALLGLLLATGVAAGHAGAALAGAAGMALGAVLAMATAFAATWLGGRAIRAAVARAGAELDLVLTTGLRSAGATGIAAQALGVLGALGLLGVGYWFHHGDMAASAGEIARRSALSLPGYAVGTALVALWLHVTCGAYATSARAGELRGELLDAGVARHITQNPALVASLVGERLEHGALAARLFGATALATVASVWLALGSGTSEAAELRFVAFPLLLWAFGLVGNGAGLFVARALEAQGALPALVRGQACAAGVWLVGLLGAGYWLYPESWLVWFLPGAAGFVGGATAASATARAFARRRGALRDALDGLGVGAFAPQAAAFGF